MNVLRVGITQSVKAPGNWHKSVNIFSIDRSLYLIARQGCAPLVKATAAIEPQSGSQVGIDLGITSLLALSTGEKIANPKGFKAKYRKLRRAQKALSRKQKGSNNRHKARLKVAKVHQEIADARKDNLHKLTTRLVRENLRHRRP